jgi:hypothetical protein
MFTFEPEADASEPRAAGTDVGFLVFFNGIRRVQSILIRDSCVSFVERLSELANAKLLPSSAVSE